MVLRLDRLCTWIFIASIALMLPSIVFVKMVDELGCYMLGAVALVDCIVNKQYKKYAIIGVFVLVFAFYVLYSIFFLKFNTPKYILMDAIIELKPFLPYLVIFAIAPVFSESEKRVAKVLCIINVALCLALAFMSDYIIKDLINHVVYIGTTCFICATTFLFLSIDSEGKVGNRDLATVIAMLVVGLSCTRAKYYGEFVFYMFFLFLYKPGVLKNFNIKHALLLVAVVAVVIAVSWNKISYYFITGNSDSFDIETMESFARPVLYATGGLILLDYFPFGSGLASFASFASSQNYSTLYYEYGINNVWGLSEDFGDFICDAYYPCLAQFGIVGIVLFALVFIKIYHHLRALIRHDAIRYKYPFIVGSMAIVFILIENIAGTLFVQTSGMLAMMLLGFSASMSKNFEEVNTLSTTKKTFTIKI